MAAIKWLVTPLVIGLIWLAYIVGVVDHYFAYFTLEGIETDQFVTILRLLFTIAALITIICAYIWFYIGGRKDIAMNLAGATTAWWVLFVISLLTAVVTASYYFLRMRSEELGFNQELIMISMLSGITFIPYYILTLFMSPLNVKYVVPGRKLIG